MVGYFQDHLNQWNKSMTKNVVGISGDMTPSDRNLKDNITVIQNALDIPIEPIASSLSASCKILPSIELETFLLVNI